MGTFANFDRICRLCGIESNDLIHLFENTSQDRNLVAIIKKYLRVTVRFWRLFQHPVIRDAPKQHKTQSRSSSPLLSLVFKRLTVLLHTEFGLLVHEYRQIFSVYISISIQRVSMTCPDATAFLATFSMKRQYHYRRGTATWTVIKANYPSKSSNAYICIAIPVWRQTSVSSCRQFKKQVNCNHLHGT